MAEPLRLPSSVGQLRSVGPPGVAAPSHGAPSAPWDLLLGCMAVYIATGVGRLHELFPVLLPLKPALVAALLALSLYLLQQSGQRRVGLLRSRTTLCLVALVVWAAFSVPGALNAGVAFRPSLTDFLKTVLMYVVLAGSVRSVRDVERLALVYFAVTVVYAAVVLSRFHMSADAWRLGRLYDYDANDFATFIVTAVPLGLYFALTEQRLLLRLLTVIGLGVLAIGEVRSGSRGGFLALLAVAAFVLLRFTTVPARARLTGLVVILAVVFTTASDRYWTQMQTMLNPHEDYNATSEGGRLKIWKRGLGYMVDNPILGVGMGNFQVAEGTISPLAKLQERGIGVVWGAAHNSFLQVGAELGIPGLLLFVGLIASAAASLRRVAQRARGTGAAGIRVSRLAQSLMAAFVGFVVGAFFLSLAYSEMLYTLAALAVALEKTTRAEYARRLQFAGPVRV